MPSMLRRLLILSAVLLLAISQDARSAGVDTTPPQTSIDSGPISPTGTNTATFTFSGTDDVTPSGSLTFFCQLDGGLFLACASPKPYAGLGEGPHTFTVVARDAAGNFDPTPATFSWTVDTSAPNTILDSMPLDPTNQTTATFTFHASEPGDTFECRLNGPAFAACSSPAVYTVTDGGNTFAVRARDQAGNVDPSPATFTWTVDAQAPDTGIDSAPADPTSSNTATFTFHATEGATFACQIDAAPAAACNGGTVTYAGLGAGFHTFTVTATDPIGNTDPSPASFAWTVDIEAPDTSITAGPADGATTTGTTATFAFTGTDNVSPPAALTFECSLDGATFAACLSPITYSGLSRQPHTFEVRARDQAGNADPSPAGVPWTIIRSTPVITWSDPADITYPSALSGTQLNATASVPGTFAYTPPAGTTLNAGNGQSLSVVFTPTDTTSFTTASKTVHINVLKRSQAITVTQSAPASATFNTSFTVAATGGASGQPVAIATAGACSGSGSGSASVTMTSGTGTCTVTYDQAGDANYNAAPSRVETTT
ncbi:MAG: hypothetical protein ACRD0Q_01750, partial [Acidimicrobiales bacterium]